MRLMNVKDVLFREGEYLVGAEQTGSHACYLMYGVLEPGQSRTIKASIGHAEIFCLMSGSGIVEDVDGKQELNRGYSFYYQDEAEAEVTNTGTEPMVYVIAGGHTGSGEQHH